MYATSGSWNSPEHFAIRKSSNPVSYDMMISVPRIKIFDSAMEQSSPTSVFTNAAPIMRLWSAVIRSLLWKRIMPLRDKKLTFLPIYADVRNELADLIDKMNTLSGKLNHRTLDALRHSVGLFSGVFLQCSQGFGPHVGEIVYFKDTSNFDISSLASLDIIPGLSNLMQLSDVKECCDNVSEEYERVELAGGMIRWLRIFHSHYNKTNVLHRRHTFRGASRVNLYLGWRGTTINMPVLSNTKLPFPVNERSHPLYLGGHPSPFESSHKIQVCLQSADDARVSGRHTSIGT
jgi:hypothetical protein